MPVYVLERPDNNVEGLFKWQGRSRKKFSPQWRSCEARANLFMCGKDLISPL